MKEKLIYAGVIVAVVGAAVMLWAFWRPENNANFPEGTTWLCTDQKCATLNTYTMKELGEHYKENYGQLPKCRKCGKDSVRADKCAHCGKVYPQARGSSICPYCGKPQPPPAD